MDSIRTLQGMVQRIMNAAEAKQELPSAGLARELLEGTPVRPQRRSGGNRVSGVIALPVGTVKSREKMIWEWPDAGQRIIEDLH